MKLIHRFGYYLGGFSIGLVFLAFFLNGKKVSCDYGPEARVLKNINTKPIVFKNTAKTILFQKKIDSLDVINSLKSGSINFSKSDTRKEPCGIYYIENTIQNQDLILFIENCDSIATIKNVKFIDK